jgi:outer membrane lipoprotein SlyB
MLRRETPMTAYRRPASSVPQWEGNSQETQMKTIRQLLAGLLVVLPLIGTGIDSALAQGYNAAPRIDGFDIEQVPRIVPGTDLNFTLWGTPGGAATLRIDGAKQKLVLEESQVGVYQGTYTISARDRIAANSRVTANLRLGNQVASATLDETVAAAGPLNAPPETAEPRVERFDVMPSNALAPGREIGFHLRGTPGGRVTVAIDGVRGRFFLPETSPGEYSGTYTIRSDDRILPDSPVVATLRVGDAATRATLGRPLMASNALPVRSAQACANCGIVNSISPVEVKGDGGYLGAIAGGVVGALIGSQVGGGSGKTAAEVAGVVGGAYAGREIERNQKRTMHYEVGVLLQSGGTQTVSYPSEPPVRVGDRVRIVNGALVREP